MWTGFFSLVSAASDTNERLQGVIIVSRHGVRRQFPSSTHDFTKYAPGKTFETEDEVRCAHTVRTCTLAGAVVGPQLAYLLLVFSPTRLFAFRKPSGDRARSGVAAGSFSVGFLPVRSPWPGHKAAHAGCPLESSGHPSCQRQNRSTRKRVRCSQGTTSTVVVPVACLGPL